MNLAELKELLWGKNGCFTLIMDDIDLKIFMMSMTESFSELLGGRVNQVLSFVPIHSQFQGLTYIKVSK